MYDFQYCNFCFSIHKKDNTLHSENETIYSEDESIHSSDEEFIDDLDLTIESDWSSSSEDD